MSTRSTVQALQVLVIAVLVSACGGTDSDTAGENAQATRTTNKVACATHSESVVGDVNGTKTSYPTGCGGQIGYPGPAQKKLDARVGQLISVHIPNQKLPLHSTNQAILTEDHGKLRAAGPGEATIYVTDADYCSASPCNLFDVRVAPASP